MDEFKKINLLDDIKRPLLKKIYAEDTASKVIDLTIDIIKKFTKEHFKNGSYWDYVDSISDHYFSERISQLLYNRDTFDYIKSKYNGKLYDAQREYLNIIPDKFSNNQIRLDNINDLTDELFDQVEKYTINFQDNNFFISDNIDDNPHDLMIADIDAVKDNMDEIVEQMILDYIDFNLNDII